MWIFLGVSLNLVSLPNLILHTNACADMGENEQPKGWVKPFLSLAWKTMASVH